MVKGPEYTWGYEIKLQGNTIIRQLTIPCVQGNQPFKSKTDAKKTGRVVIRKLNNMQIPSITIDELKQLGVIDKEY